MRTSGIRDRVASGTGVQVLKAKDKSQVYRVEMDGPEGALIAKRCLREPGLVEYAVYRQVLARLPLEALTCYGLEDDDDPEFVWLFVEEAQGEAYSSADPEHRALAARWLAAIHTLASDLRDRVRLPERGPDHYLEVVRSSRVTVESAAANRALPVEMTAVLLDIEAQCRVLDSRWAEVSAALNELPATLVHGGFAGKNVIVGRRAGVPALLAFDWEAAGWGTPAADISRVDLDAYHSAVQERWPDVDRDALGLLAAFGRAVWSLSAIPGQAPTLLSSWGGRAIGKMTYYRDEVAASLQVPAGEV